MQDCPELQLSFRPFYFFIFINLISLRQKYQIKYNRTLLFVIHGKVSNFSEKVYFGMLADCRCSHLNKILSKEFTSLQRVKGVVKK